MSGPGSLAIESLMSYLDELLDTVFYLNDDYFLLRQLTQSDIHSVLYGPVFHIQAGLMVESANLWEQLRGRPLRDDGEWPSLRYSNELLDNRFGSRSRNYPVHIPRVMSMPIIRELTKVWEGEILRTITSTFRSTRAEINIAYLNIWYTIEKHREALQVIPCPRYYPSCFWYSHHWLQPMLDSIP